MSTKSNEPGTRADEPRVCVIGAGSAGIAAVKVLAERGIDVHCYELSDRVGGNWVWGNSNGVPASWTRLVTIG
ncbi:NAD(P)-binding protein [Nocardia sp. NPDC059239]|uniref:NAD(P)-binding protein n=1 Tax=unclassified Nocardia TaxID=2637762 RepID=UPI003691B799